MQFKYKKKRYNKIKYIHILLVCMYTIVASRESTNGKLVKIQNNN